MSGKKLTARETRMLSLAILFTLAGVILQVIPGMKFSGQLSLVIAVGCVAWLWLCHWAEESRAGKVCKRAFVICLCAGTLLFLSLEGFLLSYGSRDDSALPADAVIVLGAGVSAGAKTGRPYAPTVRAAPLRLANRQLLHPGGVRAGQVRVAGLVRPGRMNRKGPYCLTGKGKTLFTEGRRRSLWKSPAR